MSWSYRITLLYLGFVSLIITLVTISSRQKVELVSKDYYQQELDYQNKLNAISNTNALTTSIAHQVTGRSIRLTFPGEILASFEGGQIQFYCPANSDNDRVIELKPNADGIQLVPAPLLKKGSYKMCLSWKAAGKDYYSERIINLN